MKISIIGAGLAGSELALSFANRNIAVDLYEMKPAKKTPAQKLEGFGELVCSNSFRSSKLHNAVGLLKEEMRMLDSQLLKIADNCTVPAGDALAVDREKFSKEITLAIKENNNINIIAKEVEDLNQIEGIVIVATGPLTSDKLSQNILKIVGEDSLEFYDAIAPIVAKDSLDFNNCFVACRYKTEEEGDYINCPLNKQEYEEFIEFVSVANTFHAHEFEDKKYFEGCLPIEEMVKRGKDTLRYGPFKPVGLVDPKTNEEPYACLQLRKENIFGLSYNLVGCQTRMTIPEQKQAFSIIKAFKNANFERFGSVHRNTFLNSPLVLNEDLSLKVNENIFLAGQITGVEGYVESIACGQMVFYSVLSKILQKPFAKFPKNTAFGGLYNHILGTFRRKDFIYSPSNVIWSMVPPLENIKKRIPKKQKKDLLVKRAIDDLQLFIDNSIS